MGGMLCQPVTDKQSNQGEGLGLRYALSSMQGWRQEMEDAHDVQIGLRYGLEDWSYFAVFDGHAGKRAAAFAALNLLECILRDENFRLNTDNLPDHVCIEPDVKESLGYIRNIKKYAVRENIDIGKAGSPSQKSTDDEKETQESSDIKDTVKEKSSQTMSASVQSTTKEDVKEDQDNTTQPDKEHTSKLNPFVYLPICAQVNTVKDAMTSGFLRIDQSMRLCTDTSGCTAVCALISPTHLFIANCGDSRAVLWGPEQTFVTEDHKPLNPKERKRIILAGGSATQRINGTLAVSRALGDFDFKKDRHLGPCEQLVSPEPEVTALRRMATDEFLILACDGIWDVMDNVSLCGFVAYKLKIEPNLENVCSAVLDVCLHKGSRDNMSIIIVVFENGPKFDKEELERDRKNDEHIADSIRKFGEAHDDFNEFFSNLKFSLFAMTDYLKDRQAYLPPGADIFAKYDMVHDIFVKEFEEQKPDSMTDDE